MPTSTYRQEPSEPSDPGARRSEPEEGLRLRLLPWSPSRLVLCCHMPFHLFLARRQDLWLRGTGHVIAIYDANLYASEHLGAKICGAETCNLGAISPGADPLGPNINLNST